MVKLVVIFHCLYLFLFAKHINSGVLNSNNEIRLKFVRRKAVNFLKTLGKLQEALADRFLCKCVTAEHAVCHTHSFDTACIVKLLKLIAKCLVIYHRHICRKHFSHLKIKIALHIIAPFTMIFK